MTTDIDKDFLINSSIVASKNSYSPYSKFKVGAAVLANGKIYKGCNIENASYGLTICAERSAIFNAIADGATQINAISIYCSVQHPEGISRLEAEKTIRNIMPCGACRQVMYEFSSNDFLIYINDSVVRQVFRIQELLPYPFELN